MTRNLNRIFYIYTEAASAVFLAACAVIELACGAVLGGPIQIWVANPAAGVFASLALAAVWYVLRAERRYTWARS